MSELASVEKLRAYGSRVRIDHDGDYLDLWKACDEIQAEVDSRYLLLPVGTDGMPIHLGDYCEMNDERFEVRQLKTDGDYWWAIDRLGRSFLTAFCYHVKPRTVEDVLFDYEDHILTLKEAAAELRGMMGADDD